MPEKPVDRENLTNTPKTIGELHRVIRVFLGRKVVLFGLFIILVTVITAIFAPILAPYDPYAPDLDNTLLQPCREHILGTDAMGRDTLSRIIFGTRISLLVGVTAIGMAAIIGMSLGLIAGYFDGAVNIIIMRFI